MTIKVEIKFNYKYYEVFLSFLCSLGEMVAAVK